MSKAQEIVDRIQELRITLKNLLGLEEYNKRILEHEEVLSAAMKKLGNKKHFEVALILAKENTDNQISGILFALAAAKMIEDKKENGR